MWKFLAGIVVGIYVEQNYQLPNLFQMIEKTKVILKDLEKPPSK